MANTDAWGAPERVDSARRRGESGQEPTGNAKIIAEPAYRRLLAAEPILKRSIPTLIIIFLLVVAAARCLSLANWHEDVERNARAVLGLAAADLVQALTLAEAKPGTDRPDGYELIEDVARHGTIGARHLLAIADKDLTIVAAGPSGTAWEGRKLDALISGGQPLYMFGERAGVMDVRVGGEDWMVALSLTPGRAVAVAMISHDAVFAEWRKAVSLNVTLYVLTAAVLLVILYAYFSQAARAQAADRIYLEAHQRIDLALVRGRCGLWDWDMVRGKMYWSRSMYEMLGYKHCEAMLSFGEVADIIHPEDGDLFELANRIVSRETDQIDQVFRMKHADGRWVWMRARAQVVDPEAPEIQLIGIAVDVTEQRHLAARSEAADQRLRTAIESITESFVLWDSAGKLVMCNTKHQQDNYLSETDILPGTPRDTIEARMAPFVSERRLMTPAGQRGVETFERQLADGRWLQVTELKTKDGGMVSVGSDITQIKQHQEKLVDSERRLMATIHDLSLARRAEEERARELSELNKKYMNETERAEAANQAKSEFLANMSHELRTPLTPSSASRN